MRQSAKLAKLLIFLILWASAASAETINLFAGVPMGGFGDVACNVFMAQQLKRLRPDLELNFLVTEKQLKHIKVLLPTFDPKLAQQDIGGIHFFSGAENSLPRADVFVGFALKPHSGTPDGYAKDVFLPDQMMNRPDFYEILRIVSNAPLVFHTAEFGGSRFAVTGGHSNGIGGYLAYWQTGPSTGLYVLPGMPTDIPTREQTENQIAAELKIDASVLRGAKLAFGYSTFADPAIQYFEMMKGYAAARPNEKIVVVVKNFVGIEKLTLPPNLIAVPYSGISFDLTRSIIAHSEAPLLVTGDTSMSLAIEFKKIFVYERHHWKSASARSLLNELAARSPYFARKAEGGIAMSHLLNLTGDGNRGTKTKQLADFGKLLASAKFQTEYESVITAIKQERSLPAMLLKAFDAFRGDNRNAQPRGRDVHQKLADAGIPTKPSLLSHVIRGCVAAFRWIFR